MLKVETGPKKHSFRLTFKHVFPPFSDSHLKASYEIRKACLVDYPGLHFL
jgi:hypothetical protein